LGVCHAGAPADDEGFVVSPVFGEGGDAAELEDVGDVGVVELGLEGDADGGEFADGPVRFEGVQGDPGGAEGVAHVGHGGEGAFGGQIGFAVEEVVQDLGPVVGHADFVGVGEDQGNGRGDGGGVLDDLVGFAAEVTPGVLDFGQDARQG